MKTNSGGEYFFGALHCKYIHCIKYSFSLCPKSKVPCHLSIQWSLLRGFFWICCQQKSRPCAFGQSLGQPIVRSFSHFFWSTKKKLSSLREFLVSLWEFLVYQKKFWSIKKKFGISKRNLVDQKFPQTDQKFPETGQIVFWLTKKNEKKTGQLVDQESDQNHMDGTTASKL